MIQPTGNLVHVPQMVFQLPTNPNPPFVPNPSVFFFTGDGDFLNLRQARDWNLHGLANVDDPCVITDNRRITLRVLWPGYPPWRFLNMGVFDNTTNANRHTYRFIAHRLAEILETFYQEMTSPDAVGGTNPQWDLRNIDFDRLYLAELRHATPGSWQPVLYYRTD